jgi:hypothetical protein
MVVAAGCLLLSYHGIKGAFSAVCSVSFMAD